MQKSRDKISLSWNNFLQSEIKKMIFWYKNINHIFDTKRFNSSFSFKNSTAKSGIKNLVYLEFW